MTAAQSQDHHQVSAIGAPASGRRVLWMVALVVIAAICLSGSGGTDRQRDPDPEEQRRRRGR
jgi:hypothetical protein